jgi:branched-chain amino acid aminotransferase
MKGVLVNINSQLLNSDDAAISFENRSFRYGDGFFETIRCINGIPLWMEDHFHRIQRSAESLKLNLPDHATVDFFSDQIHNLLSINGLEKAARVRLSIWREAKGFYRPDGNDAGYMIEASALENEIFALNKKGMLVGVYNQLQKPTGFLSGIKSSNALVYIMASLFASENGWDDALILNTEGNIAEATSSNVFVVKKNIIYTPGIRQGCVEGVMRLNILRLAASAGYNVHETSITSKDLLDADEVFLTNTIAGVQWVKAFSDKRYYNKVASHLIELLNSSIHGSIV